MRKDDKIATLRRLLANVQANAGDRLGSRAGDPAALPMPRDVEVTPVRSFGRDPIDSWSSLDTQLPEPPPPSRGFSNTLRPPPFSPDLVALAGPLLDPEPEPRADVRAVEFVETELSLEEADDAIAEIIAKEATESTPHQPFELKAPIEELAEDEAPIAAAPSVAPPSEPRSEIARALRRATEQSLERRDPKAMWEDAAFDLRERRPTSPPTDDETEPPPPASFALPPPRSTSRPASFVPLPPLLPVSSEPPGPATLRRRRSRPFRTVRARGRDGRSFLRRTWIGASIIAALGAAAVAFSFGRGRTVDAPREPAAATNTIAQAPDAPGASATSRAASTSAPAANPVAAPSTRESAHAPVRPPVPDTKRLTEDKAYLFVDGAPDRQVYVNGILAGDAGAWLEVGCGFRWMRLAERGPSAGGRSFPVWSSDGVSIVIPCHGATAIDMH